MSNAAAPPDTKAFAMPSGQSTFSRRVQAEMSDPGRLAEFVTFRQSLRDVWHDDFNDDLYLYRFFKAREFNALKAEEMVRNNLKWRKDYGADELLTRGFQQPEVITKFYPGGYCGVDKEGCPVWYEASGLIDPQGMAKSVPRDVLLRSRIYVCEKFVRQILPKMRQETGLPLYSCTFVVDLHNYGRRHLWKPGFEFYSEFVRLCEQNYPETIGIAFIVNAPAIFPIVFNILKPLLHQETQKKLNVLGKNYKQVLQDFINADQLPAVYGGTRTDPNGDPRCSSQICWGGEVPKEFYLRPNYPDRLTSQSIGRRSKFRVDVTVPASPEGLCIEWDFLTQDGDLGFEIVCADQSEGDKSVLLRYRRVHCGICPCSGAVVCQRPGTYTVCFDNSFSWVNSKRLKYFLHVTDRPIAKLVEDYEGMPTGGDALDKDDGENDDFEKNLEALMEKEADGASVE